MGAPIRSRELNGRNYQSGGEFPEAMGVNRQTAIVVLDMVSM